MTGDRDLNGRGYLWRVITPTQSKEIAAAIASGVAVRDLAAEYGVCERTIFRARRAASQPMQRVVVGAWAAEFLLTDEGPVRVTTWYAT